MTAYAYIYDYPLFTTKESQINDSGAALWTYEVSVLSLNPLLVKNMFRQKVPRLR